MKPKTLKGQAKKKTKAEVIPPLCPLAFDLARSGTPVGVLLWPAGPERVSVVAVDGDGVLIEVRRLPDRFAVRWCLNRHFRVHQSLGAYMQALTDGVIVGWLHGRLHHVVKGELLLLETRPFRLVEAEVVSESPAFTRAFVDSSDELEAVFDWHEKLHQQLDSMPRQSVGSWFH